MVGLDEAHASHVSSQVEHVRAALDNFLAVVHDTKVGQVELVAERFLLRQIGQRNIQQALVITAHVECLGYSYTGADARSRMHALL